ncbi:response regulator [Joostella sp. CR20]|uniref:response regulator n=1 Tax=Joostella sp. CR20 TaxID=2804312 RepID=UPI00313B0EB8
MKTILLIEDDEMLRENTVELLSLSNYNVLSAQNGMEGIKVAENSRPDLIICDIMMNPMNGYEVLDELSKNQATCTIPFIFLTAKSEYKDIRQGMNLGADDYLVKPFTEEDLLETLEKRLEKFNKQKEDLQSQSVFEKVDPKELFVKHAELNVLPKGHIIENIESKYGCVYLVKNGLIKSYKLDENGKILGLYFYTNDSFIGNLGTLKNIENNNVKAICIEKTEIYSLEKSKISKLIDNNPNLGKEFINFLSNYINNILDQFMPIAYGSATVKTVSSLTRLYEIFCSNDRNFINLSRNDIANFAGLSTETFIRELKKLKAKSLVEINKRKIIIPNIEALKQELQSLH